MTHTMLNNVFNYPYSWCVNDAAEPTGYRCQEIGPCDCYDELAVHPTVLLPAAGLGERDNSPWLIVFTLDGMISVPTLVPRTAHLE